jgi:DNA polymerase-3 subunit chi
MTERVDFYVLNSAAARQRFTFACRLTEKAYLRDLRVVLVCDAGAEPGAPSAAAPVQLTPDLEGIEGADLLVNLSARLPARLERFQRVAEVIDADEERRRLGRERFKAYRELKLPVETHQLDDTAGVQTHDH